MAVTESNAPVFEMPDARDGHAADGDYFARFAELARANGYSVIPLRPRTKSPAVDPGWRDACWSLPDMDGVRALARTSPDAGVGLACGRHMMAFDIDLEDPDAVAIMRSVVEETCGPTPLVRVGKSPKVALVYRAAGPIVSSRLPRFDILGLGSQLVAYGVHPTTGASYRWTAGAAPHLVALETIPVVSQEQCLAVASDLMRRLYGDRFRRFVFDMDVDPLAIALSSRSTLAGQLLARLFRGVAGARARFHRKVLEDRVPPGIWGFVMRPEMHGPFDHGAFSRQLPAAEVAARIKAAAAPS